MGLRFSGLGLSKFKGAGMYPEGCLKDLSRLQELSLLGRGT